MHLGIDAGQTGVRAVLEGGRPGPQTPGVRRMEGAIGPDDVADALLAATLGMDADGGTVAVGLSGFELAGDPELAHIAQRLRAGTGAGRVAIASDGVTSLLGALGRRPGVVVAVGTGVVVLGHDGGDGWAKVDGWGSMLGDDGSGYGIGVAGLRAAVRAADGRERGSTALLAEVEAEYGSVDEMPIALHRAHSTQRAVASFAPAVARAAAAGDPIAAAIWERAGEELAISAAAAAGRVFARADEVAVARVGNVWRAGSLVTAPFERALFERLPRAAIVEAAGTSLDGALVLARADGELAPVPGLLWWDREAA